MNPLAVASNSLSLPALPLSTLPPSQTGASLNPVDSCALFAQAFTGASNIANTSASLETAFKEVGSTIGPYLSNRELVRASGVSRAMHANICNHILSTKVLGTNAAQFKDKLGEKFACFVKHEAQFCNSLQNTQISFKYVAYDRIRHQLFRHDTHRQFGQQHSRSRWGDSKAKTDRNTIHITHQCGASIERHLDPLLTSPSTPHLAFSSDGSICAALSGRNPALLHIWQLDSTGVWQTIDCPVLPVSGTCTNLRVSDNGSVFIISKALCAPYFLHCWQPDIGQYSHYRLEQNVDSVDINAISPNGKCLLLWLDTRLILAMTSAAGKLTPIKLPVPAYSSGCFSPDSDMLVLDLAGKHGTLFLSLPELLMGQPIEKQYVRRLVAGRTQMGERLDFAPDGKSIIRAPLIGPSTLSIHEFYFPFTSPQAQMARADALAVGVSAAANVAKQHPMMVKVKYANEFVPQRQGQAQSRLSRLFLKSTPLQTIFRLAQKLHENDPEQRRIAEQAKEMQRILQQEPASQHRALLSKPIAAICAASGSTTLQKMAQAAGRLQLSITHGTL